MLTMKQLATQRRTFLRIATNGQRAKQLSFSATGSPQKCLGMQRHLHSHCRQANSHSFGRIKEIVPLLVSVCNYHQKRIGQVCTQCVVCQNKILQQHLCGFYTNFSHHLAAAVLYIIGLEVIWSKRANFPLLNTNRQHIVWFRC